MSLFKNYLERLIQANTDADAQGGSPVAGTPVVRKFSFNFNTQNILTGAAIYTPTVGDLLLDAWVEVSIPWNGTTPLADIGTFVNDHVGILGNTSGELWDMTLEDVDLDGSSGYLLNYSAGYVKGPSNYPLSSSNVGAESPLAGGGNSTSYVRTVPAKFTAANPFKICVSQNGANNGVDPGSTQGAAILYLVTVTPTG